MIAKGIDNAWDFVLMHTYWYTGVQYVKLSANIWSDNADFLLYICLCECEIGDIEITGDILVSKLQ